jgi:hypothetical protein
MKEEYRKCNDNDQEYEGAGQETRYGPGQLEVVREAVCQGYSGERRYNGRTDHFFMVNLHKHENTWHIYG